MAAKRANRFVRIAGLVVLLQFFGCGLVIFVNFLHPFLSEGAVAIIGLILFPELLILFVVGKSIQIISRMRAAKRMAPIPSADAHLRR